MQSVKEKSVEVIKSMNLIIVLFKRCTPFCLLKMDKIAVSFTISEKSKENWFINLVNRIIQLKHISRYFDGKKNWNSR